MKIKFTAKPLGRPEYKIGDIVEFDGRIEEAYAQKYIDRGWAEEVKASKPAPEPKQEEPEAKQPEPAKSAPAFSHKK